LRTALLQSAEAILDRDGIAGLTLRAAAREAGVSHAAPTHHFRDLTGLLTALAAAGFVRFRERLQTLADAAGTSASSRLAAMGRGYIEFAKAHPGLFQLMFRSERLDWSSPALSEAGAAAFALLSEDQGSGRTRARVDRTEAFARSMARWSLLHGLAMLMLDGRFDAMAEKMGVTETARATDAILDRLAND
jgi:AcrR family transcriptional regulator